MGLGSKLKGAWRKVEKEAKRTANKAAGAMTSGAGGSWLGVGLGTLIPGVGVVAGSFLGSVVGGAAGWDVGYRGQERMVKGAIDDAMGKEPEVENPSWTDAQATASNEGAAYDPNDERRKRAAASYSLSRTRSVRTGRVLGGTIGGAGTGGGSSAKTGGSV